MKTYIKPKNEEKCCGKVVYNSTNCHNKIRKTATNKFEKITLIGKHAFGYQVAVENKYTGDTKITGFPLRKQALMFFMLNKNKYK